MKKTISKEAQKKVFGGKIFDVWCSVVCCDGTSYQYSGPVSSMSQAYGNASNLCNSHQGVNLLTCNPTTN